MGGLCNETSLKYFFDPEASNDHSYLFSPNGNDTVLADMLFQANCTQELFEDLSFPENFQPPYFSQTYRAVGTIFQGVFLLMGVLGNSLVVYVVARTKSMHSPTNCYLVSLALADTIVLIAAVPQEILQYYLPAHQWIWGKIGCSAFIFFQYLGINASSLSLTAFTLERYIAICHPLKAHRMCTLSRARGITIGVWVFAILYCSPWLVFLTTIVPLDYYGHPDLVSCTFKLSREQYLVYYFADFVLFYLVPLLLATVLYSLIARTLFHSGRVKARKENNGNNAQVTIDSTKNNAERIQVIKMLVMVVVIFALLWLPYRGMLVYNSIAALFNAEPLLDLWFLMFAKTCVFLNSAINSILYSAMSKKFRQAFGRALTCGKNRKYFESWPCCGTKRKDKTGNTSLPVSSNSAVTASLQTISTNGVSSSCSSSASTSPNSRPKFSTAVEILSQNRDQHVRENSTNNFLPSNQPTNWQSIEVIVNAGENIPSGQEHDTTRL